MALTQAQIDALNGYVNMTHTQSSAALGHSTGMMSSLINGTENLLPTAGAIAGGIGGAAAGGLAGIESGPGAIATGYLGGVAGSGAGAAAGEALKEKLQGGPLQGGEIAKQGVLNAAYEAIGGPLLGLGGKVLSKTAKPLLSTAGKLMEKAGSAFGAKPVAEAITERSIKPPVKLATSRVAATADMMTKKDIKAATLENRVANSGKVLASATEKRAGELLSGKTFSNPIKTVKVIKDEISTRGREAETYLEKNPQSISNAEDYTMFQQQRIESEKYMTPAAVKAYDEQIKVFQRVLKDFTGDGGYTTPNYYKALKNFESNVTENLPKGKEALLDEGGSARIQAAKDVRTVVRDMIGQKNPEYNQKMFDIASLYDARDNVLSAVASKVKNSTTFAKRHPIVTKGAEAAAIGAAGAVGVDAVYQGSRDILGQ